MSNKQKSVLEDTRKTPIQELMDEVEMDFNNGVGYSARMFYNTLKRKLKDEKKFIEDIEDNVPYWNASEDKPEFDGMYLCTVREVEPCGTIWIRHKIVQLHFNMWLTLENQEVLEWMRLPKISESLNNINLVKQI